MRALIFWSRFIEYSFSISFTLAWLFMLFTFKKRQLSFAKKRGVADRTCTPPQNKHFHQTTDKKPKIVPCGAMLKWNKLLEKYSNMPQKKEIEFCGMCCKVTVTTHSAEATKNPSGGDLVAGCLKYRCVVLCF